MIAFTVPLFVILLVTSQYIDAYPSASSIGSNKHHPIVSRLKRDFGVLQHHGSPSNSNDDLTSYTDENLSLPSVYSIIQRANRKRLIDF